MKCPVCKTTLTKIGSELRKYRDVDGRVYKTINWPKYGPCPRLMDPAAHPACHGHTESALAEGTVEWED